MSAGLVASALVIACGAIGMLRCDAIARSLAAPDTGVPQVSHRLRRASRFMVAYGLVMLAAVVVP